jgi:hypothetical protein
VNKYPYHGYIVSHLLDCGIDKLVMLEQNYVDMMIQHRLEAICSVHNTRSSNSRMSLKLPSAMSIEFFSQQVLIVAHVDVSMNLSMRQ